MRAAYRDNPELLVRVPEMYAAKQPMRLIAVELGISEKAVRTCLRKVGIPPRPRSEPRVTPERVASTVEMYREGLSVGEIGRRLGVSDSTIYGWLRRADEPRRGHSEAARLWLSAIPRSQHGSAIHSRLNKEHPRSGICEECHEPADTQYAYLWHPLPYTDRRDDYKELCPRCHRRADTARRKQVYAAFLQLAETFDFDAKRLTFRRAAA